MRSFEGTLQFELPKLPDSGAKELAIPLKSVYSFRIMKPALLVFTLMSSIAVAPVCFGQGPVSSLIPVSGRVVVEPIYPSPFREEITLTFMDANGVAVADAVVSESIKVTNFSATRGGVSGKVRLQSDGKFQLLLPPREFHLIVRSRPTARSGETANGVTYFLKSVQTGTTNLLESPLVVKSTSPDEIVITFAQCTAETRAKC